MSEKRIEIPIPEGASMREEAALVAAHPDFQRLREQAYADRAAGRSEIFEGPEEHMVTEDAVCKDIDELLKEAAAGRHIVAITRNGAPIAALISWEELEDLRARAAG